MTCRGPSGDWYKSAPNIQGFVLDIYGVLYDENDMGPYPIEGSIEAVTKLKNNNIPVRLCSNTSNKIKKMVAKKLQTLGFDIGEEMIFAPAPAVAQYLKDKHLRPHFLVHEAVLPEFEGIDTTEPNCVVIGDATTGFSYEAMNTAFRILIGAETPILITMGGGKYYNNKGNPALDVGSFSKALEFASDTEAITIGKPAKEFFLATLKDMGLTPENTVMIGDDIFSDVGGAQTAGMIGVQVRTGKYRQSYEPHTSVKPDGYVDNLLQAVDLYLNHR